jgi:FMN phosphatase YigB (HAD superfamily)
MRPGPGARGPRPGPSCGEGGILVVCCTMKIYRLPSEANSLIFDIDNTLYRNDHYCDLQVELLVDRFAKKMNLSQDSAQKLISARKELHARTSGGKATSTGNIMLELGVTIAENARWRDELFEPERHLTRDQATVDALRVLSTRYSLAAVTNNTNSIGRRTLSHLGLISFFPVIVGLDTCFVSKPAAQPYREALLRLSTDPEQAVSIGDRYSVDIEVPLSMGMGGLLVEKLDDLYRLPEVLPQARKL